MTVPAATSSIAYTADGTTAVFPYTWEIAQTADLIVYTVAVAATVAVKLALTSGYTVSGAGIATGGNVTLVAGNPAAGTRVFIASDPGLIQQLLLEQGIAMNPADIMSALDLLTREVQATRRLVNNALQIPVAESLDGYSTTFPLKAGRASGFVYFDANGNAGIATGASAVPVSIAMTPVLASATLALARAAMGPWGDALVTATGALTARSLADRFGFQFNVKDFGAKGDAATDDTVAIQAAINAAQIAGGTVYFPLGTYKTTDELLITKDGVRLLGEATAENLSSGSRIATTSTSKSIVRVSTSVQSISGFEALNLALYGAGNGGTAGSGLHFDSTTAGRVILGVRVCNVHAKNCKQHGIRFDASVSTAFIFDVKLEKIRSVNNFGSGLRADGSVIQVSVDRLYTESNGASQIALVGADQTTNPQGWLFNGYAIGMNPAVAGTAGLYLENAFQVSAYNVWHESNANAEAIFKSCKGVIVEGGRISQAGTCDGIVIGFSGAFAGGDISINVPGWSNTSSKTRVDVSQFPGGSFTTPVLLGYCADGPILVDDVTGYASAFPVDSIFFAARQNITRTAHVGRAGTPQSGTWTASNQPVQWLRTPSINTTQAIAFEGPTGPNALGGSGGVTTTLKGIKPTKVRFVYELANAGDAGDDIQVGLQIQTQPANGVVTPAATNKAFSYDTAHSTANKRANVGAAGTVYNTMDCTITSPTWLGEGDQFVPIFQVVEANDATHALAVTLRAVIVFYIESAA